MQEVYGKLEEPDGLAGLVRLRRCGPNLQDQVAYLRQRRTFHVI